MNIIILFTGSMVGIAYLTELFMAWYSGVEFEQYAFLIEQQVHIGGLMHQ